MSKDASKNKGATAHLLQRPEAVVDPVFGINIVDLGRTETL